MQIGEIVHLFTPGLGLDCPAIVTSIQPSGNPTLTVFSEPRDGGGFRFLSDVQHGMGAGQWHALDECPSAAKERSSG